MRKFRVGRTMLGKGRKGPRAMKRMHEREYMHSEECEKAREVNRGWLRNGNPAGDPSKSPRCGARTRSGKRCRAPAMWSKAAGRYTRCRIHGGASTGPQTAAGIASAHMDFGTLNASDLQAHLQLHLDALEPGVRQQIEQRVGL